MLRDVQLASGRGGFGLALALFTGLLAGRLPVVFNKKAEQLTIAQLFAFSTGRSLAIEEGG